MSELLRERLLAQFKRRFCYVDLPELGEDPLTGQPVRLRLQSLSELERSEFEVEQMGNRFGTDREDRLREARRALLIATLVDDDGNLLLRPTDLDALGGVDSAITGKIYAKALKHCGLQKSDVEELLGNSRETRAGASPCASPSPSESPTST